MPGVLKTEVYPCFFTSIGAQLRLTKNEFSTSKIALNLGQFCGVLITKFDISERAFLSLGARGSSFGAFCHFLGFLKVDIRKMKM